ncbi:MAG: PEP-CTERM sorting domain-containing protein [Betaproteobacteria bacterium]|nr:PEP-CTERM sorting domain-containing protein [Betaproteobacteria bacterium]
MPGGVGVDKPNMFDNISANADGTITLLEDVGGADHNGKVWQFDPASGQLTMLAKFDPALFGDIVNGSFVAGTHTNDEETSGVIDLTNVLGFNDGASYRLLVAQDHSDAQHLIDIGAMDPNANPAEMIEGGQLLVMRIAPVPEPETYALMAAGLGIVGAAAARRRKHK